MRGQGRQAWTKMRNRILVYVCVYSVSRHSTKLKQCNTMIHDGSPSPAHYRFQCVGLGLESSVKLVTSKAPYLPPTIEFYPLQSSGSADPASQPTRQGESLLLRCGSLFKCHSLLPHALSLLLLVSLKNGGGTRHVSLLIKSELSRRRHICGASGKNE